MLTINNTLDGYLKDVEIKGNTIQDSENLADIRSVGDKVEGQELYEIPVLSCGKNLFDSSKYGDIISNYDYTVSGGYKCKYIKLKPNTTYTVSASASDNVGALFINIDREVFRSGYLDLRLTTSVSKTYTTDDTGLLYIGTSSSNDTLVKLLLDRDIQIEESTKATPYEPYQEDKLTILSPVQLEKVGDVADRIICKDGVWGVEKNTGSVVLDGNETYTLDPSVNSDIVNYYFTHLSVNVGQTINGRAILTSHSKFMHNLSEQEHCYVGASSRLYLVTAKSRANSVDEFVKLVKANNIIVKYQLEEPQFIPLPHDQQVKLRTFANKTNIHFETEIEGTIKAQVPKSIGATVNTHTEQINNLNKELDRVKKLEESTVSTVTTESDFTTVEATSNGYFEDVKLEGKTLVNLFPNVAGVLQNNGAFISISAKNLNLISGKTYTILFKDVDNSKIKNYKISRIGNDAYLTSKLFTIAIDGYDTSRGSDIFVYPVSGYTFTQTDADNLKIVILEGDHTQNPPSYFEGLKSVGDGVDEIVVSSVKGDGNLFDTSNIVQGCTEYKDNTLSVKPSNHISIVEHIRVVPDKTYYITPNNITWMITFLDCNKKWIGSSVKNPIEIPKDCYYVKIRTFDEYPGEFEFYSKNICFTDKADFTAFKHQSDKKRLLYYNNETQAWEKPTLREWDSIEKHANGKYYYHQRSGEVVLNGSEDWVLMNDFSSKIYATPLIGAKDLLMCDKVQVRNYSTSAENYWALYYSSNYLRLQCPYATIYEFKQWLQANNTTVVYQLAQEKVYECTNIDLITYANETNYIVECGAIAPRTTLKVHNNISNVVSLLQKKVSLLESNITSYMITQNRLMLASRYNADTVSFKVDVATLRNSFEYDNDLYELILNNILVGKDNYDREYIENLIIFYWMDFVISDEMYLTLFEIIEEQHNPKIEEETPLI